MRKTGKRDHLLKKPFNMLGSQNSQTFILEGLETTRMSMALTINLKCSQLLITRTIRNLKTLRKFKKKPLNLNSDRIVLKQINSKIYIKNTNQY